MGSRTPIGRMLWMSTLGAMMAEGTLVLRTCPNCGFHGRVDLEHMVDVLGGPEFSLWDCRPPCPLCEKPMHHMASPGEGSIFRPLLSQPEDAEEHPLPARAWMKGWTGRRL
jgi:hypothetical protein